MDIFHLGYVVVDIHFFAAATKLPAKRSSRLFTLEAFYLNSLVLPPIPHQT